MPFSSSETFADLPARPARGEDLAPPEVSIVVPTLNEATNLPELLRRIDAAMRPWSYEVLIVDDGSTDGTEAVCAKLAERYPVELHVRERPIGGLSGAVVEGFRAGRGAILVVLDADLQHPPERLPDLIRPLVSGEAEFVVGSRHVAGGSTAERWGVLRRINSTVATVLARPFAGPTRDPMSGFFALHKTTFERAKRLTPLGYKVGLELMCKCRVTRVAEVPIHFDARGAGASKLTVAQQFKYLEHLSRLYDFCYPRVSPVAKFCVVMLIGGFVSLGLFGLLLTAGLKPFPAASLAYPANLLVTAVFHARYVRAQRAFMPTRHPYRDFLIVALAEWVACAGVVTWLADRLREASALEVFIIPFGAAMMARYVFRKEFLLDVRGLRREFRAEEG
jgi:dolichol-phosphate mannosyltransferase